MDDEVMAESDGEDVRTVSLDIKEADVGDVALGDEVAVTLVGTVKSLSAPYEYKDSKGKMKKDRFGRMSLKVGSITVKEETENEFEELAKDEEED